MVQWEKQPLDTRISTSSKQAEKTMQLQSTFHVKGMNESKAKSPKE